MKIFGITALGKDGKYYALQFECGDFIDCENMIHQLGLSVADEGYGELIEIPDFLIGPPDIEKKDGEH